MVRLKPCLHGKMAQDIKEHLETENMEEETTEYQRN
jgi:hypothetical protein